MQASVKNQHASAAGNMTGTQNPPSKTHKDGAQHPTDGADEEKGENRPSRSTSCRTNSGYFHPRNHPQPSPAKTPVLIVPGWRAGAVQLCSKSAKKLQWRSSTYVCQERKCCDRVDEEYNIDRKRIERIFCRNYEDCWKKPLEQRWLRRRSGGHSRGCVRDVNQVEEAA